MPTEPPERGAEPPGRRRRPRRKIPAWTLPATAVVLVAAGGVAYLLRGPIGAGLTTAYLSSRGTPARIHIDRLDASGFSGSLELGDPRDPDLTVDRIEAAFAPGFIWRDGLAAPRIQSIRLVRPRLKASFDGKRLRLGSLQKLVDELLARPSAGEPAPDIDARQGRVTLATPAGVLALDGDARVKAGRLERLDARLEPGRLAARGIVAELAAGEISLVGGADLKGRLGLRLDRLTLGDVRFRDVTAGVGLRGPYPTSSRLETLGPVELALQVQAAEASRPGQHLRAPMALVSFNGLVRGPAERLAAAGDLHASLTTAAIEAGQARAQSLSADLTLASLQARLGGGWRVETPVSGRISLARPAYGQDRGAAGFETIDWSGRGELAADASGLKGSLGGGARARHATLAPRSMLASYLQGADVDAPGLELDLQPGGLSLGASRPIRLTGARKVSATFSGKSGAALFRSNATGADGAFDVAIQGPGQSRARLSVPGYRIRGAGGGWTLDSRTSIVTRLDADPVRGGDFRTSGRAVYRGGAFSFAPDGCAPVAVKAVLTSGQPVLTDAAASLCPAAGVPFLRAGARGWSFSADARDARATAPRLQVQVKAAEARLELAGRTAMRGSAVLRKAVIADTAPQSELRFRPVRAAGQARSAGDGSWQGEFELTEDVHGRPIGRALVVHDLGSGRGEAQLRAPDLVFARSGLQPGDVFPFASALASQAEGRVSFQGWTRWTPKAVTSGGRLATEGLSFRSLLGKVDGLRTDVRFDSLAPLTTSPGQTATASEVESITPLKQVQARFDLRPAALHVEAAQADAAGGRLALKPMDIPYAPPHATSGTVSFSGIDLGAVVASSSFSDRVSAQVKVDGEVRFATGADGVKITGGQAYAIAPGRLSIKRAALAGAVASGGAAQSSPDAMRELTYQALENLAFDRLDATIEPRPNGRLGVLFHIAGRHDPEKAPDARISVFDVLRGTAFKKSIPLPKGTPINLTLDTSINFDELMRDYLSASHGGSAGVQP